MTAREILDRGADRIRSELSDRPLVQAQLMYTIGSVYRELGLFAQAQPLLEQSLSIRATKLDVNNEDFQTGQMELARLAQQQGRFAVAESLYRKTIDERERCTAPAIPRWLHLSVALAE